MLTDEELAAEKAILNNLAVGLESPEPEEVGDLEDSGRKGDAPGRTRLSAHPTLTELRGRRLRPARRARIRIVPDPVKEVR